MPIVATTDRIGKGLVLPFRRLGTGLATGEGVDVVATQVQIVLGTLCAFPGSAGELSYNQLLGSRVQHLRHKSATDLSTRELATLYVAEKIRDHVTHAKLTGINFVSDSNNRLIEVEVSFDVLDRKGGLVIESGLKETVLL